MTDPTDAGKAPFPRDSRSRISFWRHLVRRSLGRIPTPFYLFSAEPVQEALNELAGLGKSLPVPVRHWLSFKTQPLKPLLDWWRRQGGGVEVVSEFEFRAAIQQGFTHDRILVNGPAKHRWLPHCGVDRLRVNFDSDREMRCLLAQARKQNWSIGVRCRTSEESNPKNPNLPSQFGMPPAEAISVIQRLLKSRVRVETVHFHLRTNVPVPSLYGRAIAEVTDICRAAGFSPRYLDCGGGFPPPFVDSRAGRAFDARFDLAELAHIYRNALDSFGKVEELWLENGRYLAARSGVLVIRILDAKEMGGGRQLICDGGRTMNALISLWETHELFSEPHRKGPTCLTSVSGPTCMAFDCLGRWPLSSRIRVGDYLVWLDAGAYHLPWETHFSHGLAGVVWHEGGMLQTVRNSEAFEDWWGRWISGQRWSVRTPKAKEDRTKRGGA